MRRRRLCAGLAVLAFVATASEAYVPPPERIHDAIADTNKADGRDKAVRLELTMQVGDRTGVATGELVSHPTGLARLELRGAGGLIERHLLQGNELSATRNGQPLDDPRAFLIPFFILQADRPETLRAALKTFDIQADQIGLAECGEADCLVVGDPTRAVPRPEPPPVRGLDAYQAITGTGPDAAPESGFTPGARGAGITTPDGRPLTGLTKDGESHAWPRVWVEARGYEIRGFDDARGVKIRLGPIASFDKLRVPAWITIEEPGRVPVRFDVVGASQVTAPASAFDRDWLFAVEDAPAPPGAIGDAPPGR